ncbi:MAG TPA: hypothetical protein VKB78_01505, partial [Pirellulales bacterium]|nr:hypothetical protein [Pirellulales bacterium]
MANTLMSARSIVCHVAVVISAVVALPSPGGALLSPNAASAADRADHESFVNSLGIRLVKIPAGEF